METVGEEGFPFELLIAGGVEGRWNVDLRGFK